jgi:hypothetical protein
MISKHSVRQHLALFRRTFGYVRHLNAVRFRCARTITYQLVGMSNELVGNLLMPKIVAPPPKTGARHKLLDAAVLRIRRNGYAATTVDQLCADAGVTKGAFFLHFKSKDALAIACSV